VYLCHNKKPLKSPLPRNVHQRPGIQSVNGNTATLTDGSQVSHYHYSLILFVFTTLSQFEH
jgi:hypothetical protein